MKNCPNCQSEVPKEFDICWKCNYDFQSKEILERQVASEAEKESYQVKQLKCLNMLVKRNFMKENVMMFGEKSEN
jgi:predicted amidophosphoribosyltransferase